MWNRKTGFVFAAIGVKIDSGAHNVPHLIGRPLQTPGGLPVKAIHKELCPETNPP
jgi:hypothetical protein